MPESNKQVQRYEFEASFWRQIGTDNSPKPPKFVQTMTASVGARACAITPAI